MNNQSGALSLDFIFALVLVLSMTFLLGVFSFSLSVVEGIQYITYSSSRAYFAGHISETHQKKAAQDKFDQLSQTGSYKKLLRKDWFNVTVDNIGDNGETYGSTEAQDIFTGVRTKVIVGLLNQNLPIFGTTEGETPFVAHLTSFLGREPTTEECMGVISQRLQKILTLEGLSTASAYVQPGGYAVFDDNGC